MNKSDVVNMKFKEIFISLIAILFVSCSSIKKVVLDISEKYQYHVGFYLYDPVAKKELLNIQGTQYFTPASNTKIFTLYSANLVLPDSIPAFRYVKTDTALFIWGLADPSFLNDKLLQGNVYSYLAGTPKIYFSNSNFNGLRFGYGWAWDDYKDNYSQEKTPFPIYGNSVVFDIDSLTHQLQITPAIFSDSTTVKLGKNYGVRRQEFSNKFDWDTTSCNKCERLRPIYNSPQTFKQLMQDTLHVPVQLNTLPLPDSALTYYSIPKDSLLKVMMQESDNLMAEHLLLSVSGQLTDTLSTEIGIREMSKQINTFVPDKLNWRDGSGLSRYNLFTPQTIVYLWNEVYIDMGEDRLFNLISIGGKAGTLENWFKAETPYIYGKTGTLSNVYNLSGFLIAKSGKRLIFSYMNNNYTVSANDIRKEMEIVLRKVYEKY